MNILLVSDEKLESNMAMEYMHDELLSQLKAYGASDEQINEWQEQWYSSVESAGDPLPCPKCFYEGQPIGHLQPLPAEPKHAKSKCAACKTYFEYPDED
jgi:hypothetical protein